MNPLLEQMQEPNEADYKKAENDMAQALLSFRKLDDTQKMRLLNELAKATIGITLYEMLEMCKTIK